MDELCQFCDRQLSTPLDNADSMIDQTEVTSEITITEYIVYAACAFSIHDLIVFCIACHQLGYESSQSFPVHIPTAPYQSRKIRKDYSKAVKREAEKKA